MSLARSGHCRGLTTGVLLVGVVGALVVGCANGPGPSVATDQAGRAAPAPPSPPPPIAPGLVQAFGTTVRLELEPATERALRSRQMEWLNQDPGQGQQPGRNDGSGTIDVRVTGGVIATPGTPPRGRVTTLGRAMLVRDAVELSFTDLVVDLDAGHVEATHESRRVDMLDLDTSRASWSFEPHLTPALVGVDATFSPDVRREVTDRLGTDLSEDESHLSLETDVQLSP